MNNRMEREINTLTNSHQTELDDKIQQLDVSTTTKVLPVFSLFYDYCKIT